MASAKSDIDRMQAGYDGNVAVTHNNGVAILTMNCGENRMNKCFLDKLHSALDDIVKNENVKALITTGSGKYYCNGLDLKWLKYLQDQHPTVLADFLPSETRRFYNRMLTLPFPTVCAVNGHAFAGGAIITLMHDVIIMQRERGWWALNEVHLGMLFGEGLPPVFRKKIGRGHRFHEAVLLGRRYTAQEALDSGIIQEVCPSSALLDTALAWVERTVPKGGYDRKHLQDMRSDVIGVIKPDPRATVKNYALSKV